MTEPKDGVEVEVDGLKLCVPFAIRTVGSTANLKLVLLDPDAYLADPGYREKRRAGAPALRNLQAFRSDGVKLWEAELPEPVDYYHELLGVSPIEAHSFSGYRCVISEIDGRLLAKTFLK